MDTLGVMAQDAVLRNTVFSSDWSTFFVATAAHAGDIEFRYPRFRVAGGEDIVCAVTIPASRGEFLACVGQFTVKALMVYLGNIVVAETAIDRFEVLGVREIRVDQVDVAVGAVE